MTQPRMQAIELNLDTVGGQSWSLADQTPDTFTLLVFYRGMHCPVCKTYLQTLEKNLGDFRNRGVNVIAVSMDDKERAEQSVKDWGLEALTVGYGLTEAAARGWDLYISEAVSDKEPDRFSEPALHLVRPDNTIYASSIQSMPFARPALDDLLKAIDFVVEKNYPARGEA
ncbi:peroxiredoxin-like family protein [Allohahella marinimesophila]|uniref:Peroxiredoxin-like family protein n=1 Tax=Allohahella marinimesophila TaxID=1054972 RepID=A0ABP7PNL6_9GAMM